MQTKTPFFSRLYVQVLIAIALGVTLGALAPDLGAKMKPLGDAFIKLIKMMIAPIIFATVVVGIAKMGDMKEVGRVGVKALFYFEAVTTLALVIGLVVVNLLQPGAGLNIDPHTLHAKDIAKYTAGAKEMNTVDFLLHIIPDTVVGAFASGEILQVLTFSVLLGLALTKMGDNGKNIVHILDEFSHALFGVINMLMKLAPIGAFGAMAFTIGKYGIGSLKQLGFLMACVYLTCFAFVFIVLGTIARFSGFSLWRFLVYIKEEILLVLGTSSSESALPGIMKKLENLGCSKPVVGMVVPTGYSFNLDGTSIYLTMAAIFIAQATNVNLTLGEELAIIGVLLLTSKGAAAVTGGGFITLAATLATLGGKLPVEGLALLIGIDRFMSEARAITNLIGNGVATVVIAKWEKALDVEKMRQVLEGAEPPAPPRNRQEAAPEPALQTS
ncbi:dicarboxylate/amino acid:cation symporter [Chromobacterium piscinae]|uniref:dicarboxylate/amino acid:cation symporter n=1 Tax=Chromobacterium piscinae TaxID=686831 RepID=UPI001C8C1DE4|nr:dicarboxylate/amino acid:cation symporter [Chromobacterium piscinae]MBX9297966.1 dicarboxylate/amino acid:cation symporter [Chromobacterium vaccinii]MBX9348256.1 dicarboxylate/amino acid:cation symporter [Chromobacterium vaccinii]MBX9357245.1 dicarboxylate/amino acid:cation symporter [Chromobacterium vaccinii]MCD5329149.1 dicarboxylate/amino acid:cation symporter [Chromobacterium piscinae]